MNKVIVFSLLALCITACSPAQQPTPGMGQLLDGKTQGYSPVEPNVILRFPGDHMAHDDFRQEWWYLTANLETESKQRIGLQWTQFRIALAPPSAMSNEQDAPINSASWQTQQLYMSHTAVTSTSNHLAEEKWSRGHQSIAGTQAQPLSIRQDDWQWLSQSEHLFPATLSVSGQDFSYQLQLDSTAPFQLQGDNGYSEKECSWQRRLLLLQPTFYQCQWQRSYRW